ncbi:hypothetical protein GCM10010171_28110 [Actinokineospora fastidiosa]|uniref:Uncharacterized protein n=2 Tax=Actinokineospora fastidiosa TaxID=1816 RepID=A0A918GFJ6_9PSEU|nr:hypothetical protein GCM10010171_28110 [Actinokineospora fastidiosa]
MWTMSMGADAPLEPGARHAHLLARYELQRREAETVDHERVARVDRAVREFPVSAYAASVLPVPLPVERAEKLPRAQRHTLPSGYTVRYELLEFPGELRGWLIDPTLAVSIHGTTVHPIYEPVGKQTDAALQPLSRRGPGAPAVTARIAGWQVFPAPLSVEAPTGSVPLERLLADFLSGRGR